jgi:hypothetical protein
LALKIAGSSPKMSPNSESWRITYAGKQPAIR